MVHRLLFLLFWLVVVPLITSAQTNQTSLTLGHDVSADAVLSPSDGTMMPVGFAFSISVRVTNRSEVFDERMVLVVASLQNPNKNVVFRDTLLIPILQSERVLDTTFRSSYTPSVKGKYVFTIWVVLTNDENTDNDTVRSTFKNTYLSDISRVAVIYPHDDEDVPQKIPFQAKGTFIDLGSQDYFEIPFRVQIKRLSDNVLVFQADTLVENIYADSPAATITFPSQKGNYDTKLLPVGKYKLALIVRQSDDGDRSNDTLYSVFNIIANSLSNNVMLSEIIFPTGKTNLPVDTPVAITANIRNIGKNAAWTFPITLQIQNQAKTLTFLSEQIITSLLADERSTFSFKKHLLKPGKYIVTIYSSLQGDEFLNDDTLSVGFTIGVPQDAAIVAINKPTPFERIQSTGLLTVDAVFRWLGSSSMAYPLSVTYEIFSDISQKKVIENKVSISAGQFVSDTLVNTSVTIVIDTLSEGYYHLLASLGHDDIASNNQITIPFQIGRTRLESDLQLLSITPGDSLHWNIEDSLKYAYKLFNSGRTDLNNTTVYKVLFDESGAAIQSDSVKLPLLKQGQVYSNAFSPFLFQKEGAFRVQITGSHVKDNYSSDNSLVHYVNTRQEDIGITSILSPSNDQRIKAGTFFKPTCVFTVPEIWKDFSYEPVQIVIYDSGAASPRYTGFTAIPLLHGSGKAQQVAFPSLMSGLNVSTIPPGSYIMKIIVSHPGDINHTNDSASTNFIIYGTTGVEEVSPYTFSLSNYPNPCSTSTTVQYSLSDNSTTSISFVDMMGRTARAANSAFESAGEHLQVIDCKGLAEGTYICELSVIDSKGQSSQVRKLITVLR